MRSIISLFQLGSSLKKKQVIPFILCLCLFQHSLSAAEDSRGWMHFDEVESTQTVAKNCARELLRDPRKWIAITTNHQTKSVGAYGEKLHTSPGHLCVTFMTLYPKEKLEELSKIIQVATFSVTETLNEFEARSEIKWANDILSDGKKIAHCVCEVVPSPLEEFCGLLIGVDINIDIPQEEIARNCRNMTSMSAVTREAVDKERLLEHLSDNLRCSVFRLLNGDFDSSFSEKINGLLFHKGSDVEVELAPSSVIKEKVTVKGKLEGIDDAGNLLLRMSNGDICKIKEGRILDRPNPDNSRA